MNIAALFRQRQQTLCQFASLGSRLLSNATAPLEVTNKDGVRTITLTDTKTRNALSLEMLKSLRVALGPGAVAGAEAGTDVELRCIVLKARGGVFSAGHNLKHLAVGGRAEHVAVLNECAELMAAVRRLPVPVVAEVAGVAAAAGCQLIAACDIVVAADTATFSTPGGSVGIFCSTPGVPLVRAVPRKTAALMLLTGRPITAQQALTAGLVSLVVPARELEAATAEVVGSMLSKSRAVLALGKRFMYRQIELTEEEAYREGSCVMVDNINMADGQEGIRSFVEKRKPSWTHTDDCS